MHKSSHTAVRFKLTGRRMIQAYAGDTYAGDPNLEPAVTSVGSSSDPFEIVLVPKGRTSPTTGLITSPTVLRNACIVELTVERDFYELLRS
jgi:hypothetical protein